MLSLLTNLIPPQYRLLAAGIAVVVVFGAGVGSGWAINGWRLGNQITKLESSLETAKKNNKALTTILDDQNETIRDMKAEADQRQKAAQDALEAVSGEVSTLEGQIETLRQARGKTCLDAEALLDEAFGL